MAGDVNAFSAHLDHVRFMETKSAYKQPWELGFMKPPKPFGDILVPARGCEDVSGHMLAAKRKQQELDSSAEGGLTSFGRKFPKILKQPKFSTWNAKIDYDRRAAFIKWQKILETCIIDFQVGSQIKAARFVKRTFGWNAYFEDVFAVKSTATLHSRANPILRFLKWCRLQQYIGIPFSEEVVYEFMKAYAVHAAPTFGRSFVGSLAFLHHVLGSKTSLSCVESRRVTGCASKLFLNKRALKQREPLRVEHVRMLESVCLGEHRMGLQERILSGFCLFMIYARARHSDAQSAADIHLDVAEVDGAINGYVEARVRRSKTSFSLERKTRFLPMVAPIQGVCDDAWALSWMKCMDDAGIERGQGKPLLPQLLASGKWSKIPLNAEMTAAWMRHVLERAGANRDDIQCYGTHGCKATTLSWLTKHGCPREYRLVLGYHSESKQSTDVVYGRDNVAAPLRYLDQVIQQIALKKFQPDLTRSGMLVPGRVAGQKDAKDNSAEAPEDQAAQFSDSEGSSDEESPDHVEVEDAVAELVGHWSGGLEFGAHSLGYARHYSNRTIHCFADESQLTFMCSRNMNDHYEVLQDTPCVMHPMCKQCGAKIAVAYRRVVGKGS